MSDPSGLGTDSTATPGSVQGMPAIDPNVIGAADANQGFGLPGYGKAQDLLQSEEDVHRQNALQLLRDSIQQQPEVSPNQALAAGLLAVVPAIGGYMAGRAVGAPKLSPWANLSVNDMQKVMSGPASGAMQGAAVGQSAGNQYIQSLVAQQAANNKEKQAEAQVELGQASNASKQRGSLQAADLANQAQFNTWSAERPGKVQDAIAIENAKTRNAPLSPQQQMLEAQKLAAQDGDQETLDVISSVGAGVPVTPAQVKKVISNPRYAGIFGANIGQLESGGARALGAAGNYYGKDIGEAGLDPAIQPANGFQWNRPGVDPRQAVAMDEKGKESLNTLTTSIKTALPSLERAKWALTTYGNMQSVNSINENTPEGQEQLKQLAGAMQATLSAHDVTLGALKESNPAYAGQLNERELAQLNKLASPIITAAENGDWASVKAALLTNKTSLFTGQIDELERELVHRYGTILQTHRLQYTDPIAGMQINPFAPNMGKGGGVPLGSGPDKFGSPTPAMTPTSGSLSRPHRNQFNSDDDYANALTNYISTVRGN